MKLFWGSSYDRGLDILLKFWPEILFKYPDTTLDIAYGWDLFDKAFTTNPERMAWKARVVELMEQKGVTHHGKVGKERLSEIRKECDIWAYPTYFTEINCITALECQNDGVVPCVMNLAALDETVQSGIKVQGDIYDPDVRKEYLNSLLDLLGDKKRLAREAEKGMKFASQFIWSNIAKQWVSQAF